MPHKDKSMMIYNLGKGQEPFIGVIGDWLQKESLDAWGTSKWELDPYSLNSRLTVELATEQRGFFGKVSWNLIYECWSYTADPRKIILDWAKRMESAIPELTLPESKPGNFLGMSI